jgi:hypothetical protein
MDETRTKRVHLGVDRLQAREDLLDSEVAEGIAALELGDVRRHGKDFTCAGIPPMG